MKFILLPIKIKMSTEKKSKLVTPKKISAEKKQCQNSAKGELKILQDFQKKIQGIGQMSSLTIWNFKACWF